VANIHNFQLLVGDNAVKPSACARNRVVYFDSILAFKTLINKSAADAIYYIRILAAIRDHRPLELANRLCALQQSSVVLITAALYCRGSEMRPLKLALNMAARLVFKARRSCHISDLLDQLKWLPIKKRV